MGATRPPGAAGRGRTDFQSPIPRGDGCDPIPGSDQEPGVQLSVPYSSGRWVRQSQLNADQSARRKAFSPLFLGEMGATYATQSGHAL